MELVREKKAGRQPPARYRLNRRAALLLTGVFLSAAVVAGFCCFHRLQPERRIVNLRENVELSLRSGQYRRAAIELANLVRLTPDDADAWMQFARVQLRILGENVSRDKLQGMDSTAGSAIRLDTGRERLRLAVSAYRNAAELHPELLEPQRWLLELSLRGGNWKEARARLVALSKLAPADPLIALAYEMLPTERSTELVQASHLVRDGRHEEAMALLEPCLAESPADFEPLELYAQAATLANKPAARQRAMELAAAVVGASPKLELIRGRCLWLEGRLEEASERCKAASAAPHLELAARRLRANVLRMRAEIDPAASQHCLEQAVRELRAIADLAPLDQDAPAMAAWLLGMRMGRPDEALAMTRAALKRVDRPTATLLHAHASALLIARSPANGSHCFGEALVLLDNAVKSHPDSPELQQLRQFALGLQDCQRRGESVWPALSRRRSALSPEYLDCLLPMPRTDAVATGDDGPRVSNGRSIAIRSNQL